MASPTDGRVVTTRRQAIRDENGERTFIIAVIEDVTACHRAQMERDRNKELLDRIIENIPSTIVAKDTRQLRYVLINRAGEKYFGMTREKILGRTAYDVHPRDDADYVAALDRKFIDSAERPLINQHIIATFANRKRTAQSRRFCVGGGGDEPQYLFTVIDDVTQQKEAEEKIAYLAYHDALTCLPNRVQFRERLEQELAFIGRGGKLALLYLDLDHFKDVNDTLGHLIGDQLLQAITGRIGNCVREFDIVSRLGGR